MAASSEKQNIVIIGGGIIGCTSAYYLSQHPFFSASTHTVTLLEASTIAGGASGKAGGLLARWAYPRQIVDLSFNEHAALAKKHDGARRWGYRRLGCGQVEARGQGMSNPSHNGGRLHEAAPGRDSGAVEAARVSLKKRDPDALKRLKRAGFPSDLDWVDATAAKGYNSMGTAETTAQVHPRDFTTSMADLAKDAGVSIITDAHVDKIGTIEDARSEDIHVQSVSYTRDGKSHTLPATHVVLAAGPWTQQLYARAPIGGLRAHSVVIKPRRELAPYALFTEITGGAGRAVSTPEIYARPFGEVYACGEGDQLVPLPSSTAEVEVDQQRCQDIIDQIGSISEDLRDGDVSARQACYLPVVDGPGGPFIGETADIKGLVLASGHTCWGIQNGPGTGKLVSEIVMEGQAKSAKLGDLNPAVSL